MTATDTTDSLMTTPAVRPATQAGRFYESDPSVLRREVDSLLAKHQGEETFQNLAAIIVPHAGYVFSGNVAATAYMAIPVQKKYQRIFLIGPSHYEWLNGASVNTEVDFYETPLGKVRVDTATGRRLIAADEVFGYREEAHDREHCLEVQLPFLQRRMEHVPPIVPIIISTNDFSKLKRMAEVLRPYFNDDNLFVISSDFSHYPSYVDAYEVDGRTRKAIMSGDVEQLIAVLETNARSGKRHLETSACGEYAIITLMLMLDKGVEVRHLLYQNSGDIDHHSPDRVVGYHAFAFNRKENKAADSSRAEGNADDMATAKDFSLTDEEKQALREVALGSLRSAFDSTAFSPKGITPSLRQPCGAFVTLTKNGALRGCVGHFGNDLPLYEMVAEMAQAAAFEDPRFPSLRREELPQIRVEISVLTPMRRIHSIDEFQLHRHGLYIRKGDRSGTFLPQVADEVNWTKEEFVGHCSQDKAHLGWNGWRDAELYVYEAIVF